MEATVRAEEGGLAWSVEARACASFCRDVSITGMSGERGHDLSGAIWGFCLVWACIDVINEVRGRQGTGFS